MRGSYRASGGVAHKLGVQLHHEGGRPQPRGGLIDSLIRPVHRSDLGGVAVGLLLDAFQMTKVSDSRRSKSRNGGTGQLRTSAPERSVLRGPSRPPSARRSMTSRTWLRRRAAAAGLSLAM